MLDEVMSPFDLADWGFQLLPCYSVDDEGSCLCGQGHSDNPNSAGKHPQIKEWQRNSTSDKEKIAAWLNQFDKINWAIACNVSNFLVIDVDPRNGGLHGLENLQRIAGGVLNSTFAVATGVFEENGTSVRGVHYYLRVPDGFQARANLGDQFPGVDIKRNGYVMAPGARHRTGVTYRVLQSSEIVQASEEILQLASRHSQGASSPRSREAGHLEATPYGEKALEAELNNVLAAPPGDRNNQLFKSGIAIGQLVSGGELTSESFERLARAGEAVGLSHEEVRNTIFRGGGAIERGLSEPRSRSYRVLRHTGDEGLPGFEDLLSRAGEVDWKEAFATQYEESWLVPGMIARTRSHSLYSDAGVGKSALMRQVAAELASRRDVLGLPALDHEVRVLYIDHENSILGDVVPHLKSMGFEASDLDNLRFLSFPNVGELDTQQGSADFEFLLDHFQPELVVLDTVSRTISQDENLNKTWLDFYRHSGSLLKSRNIAYVRLDHTGKNVARGQRGGSAKKGDLDFVWHLSEQGEDRLILTCEKNRIPVESTRLGVVRHQDPFRHSLVGDALSKDWATLFARYERSQEILEWVRMNMYEGSRRIGAGQLWAEHKEFFMSRNWRKREIENAHSELRVVENPMA